jgi:RES domain-containing protein
MLETEAKIKIFLIILLVFFTSNHIIALRRDTQLNAATLATTRTDIVNKLGTPKEIYNCQTDTNPPVLFKKEEWCKDSARQVVVFPRCYQSIACPGWNYVIFDEHDRLIYKYNWIKPLFPGGPKL